MGKIFSVIVVFAVLFSLVPFSAFAVEGEPDGISAETFIVCDDFGKEIFSLLPDKQMQPASTAKLLTALVAVENCSLDSVITVTPSHLDTEGSMMYLRVGETVSMGELLYGLLLSSGNDAALAIADLVCEEGEDFADLMNKKAAELGMVSSRFSNPSGLPDENTYTTARDLSRLIAAFTDNSELMEISGTCEAVFEKRTLVNHNRLLVTVSGVDCGKTGYTMAAGRCLVTSAVRNGRRIFVVTMNCPNDWDDHEKLYAAAFDRYSECQLSGLLPVSQSVVGSEKSFVRVGCSNLPSVWLSAEETAGLSSVTYMRRFEYAGVEAGEICGKTKIFCGSRLVAEVSVFYTESVKNQGTETGLNYIGMYTKKELVF
ncbi:MAG: D-alanyl-D-alanine carboxypeptidase [Clostridia bacterium]|nr:D-alanyl-D-alanine carboxypeptidase [Clostridia bacterium]